MKVTSPADIPKRATIRKEFGACSNPDCQKKHGPYLYAYWKENGSLKKVYIGTSIKDFELRLEEENKAKQYNMPLSTYRKLSFIREAAFRFRDPIALKYWELLTTKRCGPDWAYRKVYERVVKGEGKEVVKGYVLTDVKEVLPTSKEDSDKTS